MHRALSLLAGLALAACASVTHAVGTLADVVLRDRATGRPLPVYLYAGRHYVAGRPGAEFTLEIRNRSGEDLLAVASVDGVNVVSGQTAATWQGGYVLAPRARLTVNGWRKSLAQTAAFYFTQLEDSYAARTGRPHDVGVVGVALFRRRAPVPPPVAPALEERSRGAAGEPTRAHRPLPYAARAQSALGTGHGRREDAPARAVGFERASDAPEEIVILHYDSRSNLLAQGIIAGEAPRARAFPGTFVPDPPG